MILSQIKVKLTVCVLQAGVEDLRRQQLDDRDRIRALEKQLNAMELQYRQGLDGLRQELVHSQRCCDTVSDLQNRITDAERKITSTSENFDVLQNRLDKQLGGEGADGISSNDNSGFWGGFAGGGGIGGGQRDVVLAEDRLKNGLKHVEQRINNTVERIEQSCSYLENDLKDYFHRELGDLRTVFLDRFDDQAFRIADVELDVGLVKDSVSYHDKRLSKLDNNTSLLNRRLEECSCLGFEGGRGRSPPTGDQENGSGGWGAGVVGGGTGGKQGESFGPGSQRENTTEKSLEWRVIANEDQIRHFNTRLKDLSVSGDSLQDKVRNKLSS